MRLPNGIFGFAIVLKAVKIEERDYCLLRVASLGQQELSDGLSVVSDIEIH